MYMLSKNMATINIPKNASKTLEEAVERSYPGDPFGHVFFRGHKRASRVKQLVASKHGKQKAYSMTFVALIRDPVERYVSALNHRWASTHDISLDQAMDKSFIAAEDFVFSTQAYWLDCDTSQQRLFHFKDIHRVLELIGFHGVASLRNESVKRWTVSDVENHPWFDFVREKYAEDYKIIPH